MLIRVLVSSKIDNVIEDITSSVTIGVVIDVIISSIIVNSVVELVSAVGLYRVTIGKAITLLAITLAEKLARTLLSSFLDLTLGSAVSKA